jgi:micrococcal nuclease
VAICALVLAVGCSTQEQQAANIGTVTHVVDGDTVDVELGAVTERIRLIGLNTPESVDPRRPVECFGKEASAHTKSLIPEGTKVRVERDAEARDKYGRLLGYIYRVSDDMFVNEQIVKDGYAETLTIPPNVTYAERFADLARQARSAGLGLWSACANESG